MTGIRTSSTGGIGRVTLDQPPLNILTRAVLAALREALARWHDDDAIRVLLLDATGKHFSAGADVGEHLPPQHEALIPEFLDTVRAIVEFPVPVVAAVHGRCLGGGCELALAADLIVAAESARFGQPEIQLGVLPPAACALLPARVPWGAAVELVLDSEAIEAREAARLGLAHRVVPDAELAGAASALAARFARHSRAALVLGKRSLLDARGEWRKALDRAGRLYVDDLMRTADAVEGLRAFVEKRTPVWSHR